MELYFKTSDCRSVVRSLIIYFDNSDSFLLKKDKCSKSAKKRRKGSRVDI